MFEIIFADVVGLRLWPCEFIGPLLLGSNGLGLRFRFLRAFIELRQAAALGLAPLDARLQIFAGRLSGRRWACDFISVLMARATH